MKQIIVIRKDLKMRRGKEIAQGAHASMKATLLHLEDPRVKEWLDGAFTKVVVTVDSEADMLHLMHDAREAGLIAELIEDNGMTEFHGVKTVTALAVGPDTHERLAPVTGSLKLY